MPAPTTSTATAIEPDPQGAAGEPGPGGPAGREPGREPADVVLGRRGSGSTRSSSGRAAHRTTRPASRPTLVPNSSVCGAMRSVLATPTRRPKTIRPTRPTGTVLGSVIMKNRKMRTSGEITITRTKSGPHTGVNDQRAVMQCPEAARMLTPDRQA